MLSPENADGSPGNVLINQGLRAVFAAGATEHIEVRNEYLDLSRFQDADHQKFLTAYLQKKYADQKIDLVLAALSSSLDFALEARREVFPGVPVVFIAVDQQELQQRTLPPDVVGVPINRDLAGSRSAARSLRLMAVPSRRSGGSRAGW